MKCKKLISIMLVITLICTSLTLSVGANDFGKKFLSFKDTGKIKAEKLGEKEIYLIEGKEGIKLMGMQFNNYLPLNLDEEFQQDGLDVNFSAKICLRPIPSQKVPIYLILLCINFRAIPIWINEIKPVNETEPENKPPIADFKFDPAEPKTEEIVSFTDFSKDDKEVVDWSWDFGDGNTSVEQNPTHQYKLSGIYLVSLTVEDEEGETDTAQKEIAVKESEQPPDNTPPVADWNYSPLEPTIKDVIFFKDNSTDDNGVKFWLWDFGDETFSHEQNPKHQYKRPGEYTVVLTVMDVQGLKDSKSKIIEVKDVDEPDDPDEGSGTIYGTVTRCTDEKPLPNAHIIAYLNNSGRPGTHYETKTDKEGNYLIESMQPGKYIIVAAKILYHSQYKIEELEEDQKLRVDFELKPLI